MNHIFVSGITPMEAYPKDIRGEDCKQYMEEFDLCIPAVKPEVEGVNEIYINVCVEAARIIDTILGPKLIIQGKVEIKLVYTACNRVQSVHSAHWEKKFYNYILFPCIKEKSYNLVVRNIFVGIEDVCVTSVRCRDLSLSVIFILCAKVCEDKGYLVYRECYYTDSKVSNKMNIEDSPIYPNNRKLSEYIEDGLDYSERIDREYKSKENPNRKCRYYGRN